MGDRPADPDRRGLFAGRRRMALLAVQRAHSRRGPRPQPARFRIGPAQADPERGGRGSGAAMTQSVRHVRGGEGHAIWMAGDTYTLKATAESTGGSLALLEASIPPGSGPPLHTHGGEDEAFYLLAWNAGDLGGRRHDPRPCGRLRVRAARHAAPL